MTRAISIHAPRVGRDTSGCRRTWRPQKFQSTRPVWGATQFLIHIGGFFEISIHAPRVGRDCKPFSPKNAIMQFQSTRPVWGATLLTKRRYNS